MEEFKWGLSVPMIRLMAMDNTRVHYLSEKEIEMRKAKPITADMLTSDLGTPIF